MQDFFCYGVLEEESPHEYILSFVRNPKMKGEHAIFIIGMTIRGIGIFEDVACPTSRPPE